jgi:hypothetical protein
MEARSDCPECRSAGGVERGECLVCFAEVGPPRPLRFADVVAEIESVAALASLGADGNVTEACLRARALLERLRGQFLAEVILAPPGTPPVPETPPEAISA